MRKLRKQAHLIPGSSSPHLRDSHLARDRRRRCLAIPGEHRLAHLAGSEPANDLRRFRPNRIGEDQGPRVPPADSDVSGRVAGLQGCGFRPVGIFQEGGDERKFTDAHAGARDGGLDPVRGNFARVGDGGEHQVPFLCCAKNPRGEHVGGVLLSRCGGAEHVRLGETRRANSVSSGRPWVSVPVCQAAVHREG